MCAHTISDLHMYVYMYVIYDLFTYITLMMILTVLFVEGHQHGHHQT